MNHNDDFDNIIRNSGYAETSREYTDPAPYGMPENTPKAGLTARGKVALGIGSAFLAGTTLIGYQAYAAQQAENEKKAQEIALKAEALELEKLKEINRASEAGRKTQASTAKSLQADVDTCVKDREDQINDGLGSPSLRDIVDACRAQYEGVVNAAGMEQAGSARDTEADSQGVSQGVLIGGGALALVLVAAARRGKRSDAA